MPSLADDRICHVYRNRDPYPFKATATKWVEDMGDGTKEKQDICGLPMQQIPDHDEFWFCVECDRPRQSWPTPPSPKPSLPS